ncbi:MAG TPA: SDR family oxidoreductase, partial [Alphaproteobacteria bacterium]|nr:SDR family oxidoreductase [Alphaproteobacteria bacterium]
EVEVEALDRVLDINVRAAFLVAQGAARIMARGDGGAIVNMSSQMGHVGGAKRTVYCTTKFAIEGLTKSMALDLAAHGIRVNAVAPTFIETPMTRPMLDDPGFRDQVLSMIPVGKVGTPVDVAAAVVFLASPAAALITGTSLLVDGGWTAR